MTDYFGSLDLIEPPALEPITIDEVIESDYMKISLGLVENEILIGQEDRYLISNILIPAARGLAETFTGRKFYTQTWEITYDCPISTINLPFGKLQRIEAIKILKEDGTEVLQSSDKYHVDATDDGLIFLKNNQTWTYTERSKRNMKIRFVCGWDDIDKIPCDIKNALLIITLSLFENREGGSTGNNQKSGGMQKSTDSRLYTINEIPANAQQLLWSYRKIGI